jgi:hypothetical protein
MSVFDCDMISNGIAGVMLISACRIYRVSIVSIENARYR